MKKKRNTEEARLQRAVVQHLLFRANPGVIFFAVPNGMVSDPVTVCRMKAQGLLPGVADLIIFIPCDASHYGFRPYPLCLELKAGKGVLSEAQRDFRKACERINLDYAVAHSLEEAVSILTKHGALRADQNMPVVKSATPLTKAA